jgi:nucleotide-binding universal stress UspA family protein
MTLVDRLEAMQRILIAMDGSQGSQSALETATALAELAHAELEGLFIEDADLLALANLPFSHEVLLTSGVIQALDLDVLERDLRMQALAARRAMQRAATRRQLTWTFRSVRGSVFSELAAAAREVDILCIGRRGQSPLRTARFGNMVRAALGCASIILVAGAAGMALAGPVAVVVGPSGVTDSALRLAAEVAGKVGQPLLIYVTGTDSNAVEERRRQIEGMLPEGQPVRFRSIDTAHMPLLFDTLRSERQGLVICGAKSEDGQFEWLERLVDSVDCPVLVFNADAAGASAFNAQQGC